MSCERKLQLIANRINNIMIASFNTIKPDCSPKHYLSFYPSVFEGSAFEMIGHETIATKNYTNPSMYHYLSTLYPNKISRWVILSK